MRVETFRVTLLAAAFCLPLFCAPAGAQTADEYMKKAAGERDSNSRVPIFNEAVKKHPSDSRLYHRRGVAWGVMEYHDRALADFEKAVSLDPSVPAYYHDRGLALHRLKRNEEAVRDFTRLIELEPGNARAYYLRSVSYVNLKELDKAEPDLDRAIAMDPKIADEPSVRQMRGLFKSRRKKPAISIGEKSPAPETTHPPTGSAATATAAPVPGAELEGAKAKALANKARVRTNLKKYAEAEALWTELLELQPSYYPAYAERAYTLYLSGGKERAAADFRKAFDAGPDHPRVFLLRGAAACADGDLKAAADHLDRALELDPKTGRDILYSKTRSSIKRGKPCR